MARRRALEEELASTEEVLLRRHRVEAWLRLVDDELSETFDELTLPTPCRARWESMSGDEVVRRCARCERDVFDPSRMSAAELEALLARAGSCSAAPLRRRPDGRLVTRDCPAPPTRTPTRAIGLLMVALLFGAWVGAMLAWSSERRLAISPPVASSAPLSESGVDAPSREASPGQTATPKRVTRDHLDAHVRWLAPQAWEIDRALLDLLLRSAPGLRELGARSAVALGDEGRPGLRLDGVRRHALLGRLGLESGDVVLDINGHPLPQLSSLADPPSAYFVRLERDGVERVHVYRVSE